jgi:hypothetical protein
MRGAERMREGMVSRRRLKGGAASCLVLALALQIDAAQAQDAGLRGAPAGALASPSSGPLFDAERSSSGDVFPNADELRGGPAPKPLPSGVANYGQPRARPKLPKPYPPLRLHAGAKRHFKNELPPLEAYKNSAVARRALRLGARDPAEAAALKDDAPPTVAVEPTIKAKPRPKHEVDSYAPIGIGVGSMRLDPFIETSGGYDTNPDRLPSSNAPKGSSFVRADAGFKLRSDWSRDELDADMRLGYADYFDYPPANRPDGVGNLVGRYDVTRDTAIDVLGRFSLDTQRPGSPSISSGVATVTVTNRPLIFSAGTSVGATQKFNRLPVSIRGSFDRTIYQDAYYSDGSSLDLSSTSFNDYGVTGQVAYELSPSLKPLAEATYDRRIHDQPVDPYGYYRDSNGYAARAGLRVKFTDLLSGEALGGYAQRDYVDPRLQKLQGPTVDGKLTYTPTPLTTVNLSATTALNETTLSSASGALSHTFGADVSHDLFRNLRLTALGTYYINDYQGASITERGYTLGAKAEYRITRSLSLRASYSHERLTSNEPGDSYVADVFMLGLRFQP